MSISSTGLYGSATIVNTDIFDDVEALKEQVTTLSTSYLTTTNEHRIDISQNRLYISSNLSKINDLSNNRIVSIGWSKGFEFARVGFEFARGLREKVRGVYGFSSLMKQK